MQRHNPERQPFIHQEERTTVELSPVPGSQDFTPNDRPTTQTQDMILYLPAVGRSEILEKHGYQVTGIYTETQSSTILLGKNRQDQAVAIKAIPITTNGSPDKTKLKNAERAAERSSTPSFSTDTVAAQDFIIDNKAGYAFTVMEWFNPNEKPTVEMLLRAKLLTPEMVFDIVRLLTGVLEKLDQENLIHLDITPDHIMVEFDDNLKINKVWLADFGSAKTKKEAQAKKTDTASGNFDFLPPERMRPLTNQNTIDHRADIFSLTAMVHYLLTNRLYPLTKEKMAEYLDEEVKGRKNYLLNQSIANYHQGKIKIFTAEETEYLANQGFDVNKLQKVIAMGLDETPEERFTSYRAFSVAFHRTRPDVFNSKPTPTTGSNTVAATA